MHCRSSVQLAKSNLWTVFMYFCVTIHALFELSLLWKMWEVVLAKVLQLR